MKGSNLASRIKLKEISTLGNNMIRNSDVLKDIKFKIISQSVSSKPIDDLLKSTLDFIIPITSLIAYLYYLLPNKYSKLSQKDSKELERLNDQVIDLFANDSPTDKLIETFMKNNKIPSLLNLTKEEFKKQRWVIFDDTSNEHKRAFKNGNKIEFPKNNILLKFIYKDTHLRMGISLENKNEILLVNIDKKKEMQK